jgi:hypothetical protein
MAGVTAQGGSFSFSTSGVTGSLSAHYTGISVDTPQAEYINMTTINAATGTISIVPTGDWSAGTISVDYNRLGNVIVNGNPIDEQTFVGKVGTVSFSSAGYSISRHAFLESATVGARVGDLVRGTLKFRTTDYTGT